MTIPNGEDPWADRAPEPLTVSIKPSAEYDSGLLVFKGTITAIKRDLIAFFDLTDVTTENSLWEVYLEAEARARTEANPTSAKPKYGNAGGSKTGNTSSLPAKKAAPAKAEPKAETPAADEPTHDEAVANAKEELGAETVSEEKADHPFADLIAQINAAESKRDLVKLVATNKEVIVKGPKQDPDVAAAFRERQSAVAA